MADNARARELKVAHWNVQSWEPQKNPRNHKKEALIEYLKAENIQVCGISGTEWRGNPVEEHGDFVVHHARNGVQGKAGVGVIVHRTLKGRCHTRSSDQGPSPSWDRIIGFATSFAGEGLLVIVVYVPHKEDERQTFYDNLRSFMDKFWSKSHQFVVVGDFNTRSGCGHFEAWREEYRLEMRSSFVQNDVDKILVHRKSPLTVRSHTVHGLHKEARKIYINGVHSDHHLICMTFRMEGAETRGASSGVEEDPLSSLTASTVRPSTSLSPQNSNPDRVKVKVATWNVFNWEPQDKKRWRKEPLLRYLCDNDILLCGLTNTRRASDGTEKEDKYTVYHAPSGKNTKTGVGIVARNSLPLVDRGRVRARSSDRIIGLRFNYQGTHLLFVSAYCPEQKEDDKMRQEFYQDLRKLLESHRQWAIILTGDFKTREGVTAHDSNAKRLQCLMTDFELTSCERPGTRVEKIPFSQVSRQQIAANRRQDECNFGEESVGDVESRNRLVKASVKIR